MADGKTFSLSDSLKAQQALRAAAGLSEEAFSVDAFVGMISDEVEALRLRGKTDTEIATLIHHSSGIEISPQELAAHYATPEQRHGYGG